MDPSEELMDAARSARSRAYCPYSGYAVGAAIRDSSGRIWSGCNVENLSYGATICAERGAVASMVAGGSDRIVEVAVCTADGGTPCGICLQTLFEFAPEAGEVLVHTCTPDEVRGRYALGELMPSAFRSEEVKRTLSGSEAVKEIP